MTRTPGQVGRAEAALTEAGAADAGSAVVTTVAADIPASNTAAAGTATRERMAYLLAPSQEWIGFRRHVNRVFQRKTRKSAENATTRKLPAITAILHRRESGLTASSRGCPGGPPRGAREPARRRKRALRLARAGPPMAVTPSVPGRTIRGLAGRSEEHTSELQSRENLVCRLLLEKKKRKKDNICRAKPQQEQ